MPSRTQPLVTKLESLWLCLTLAAMSGAFETLRYRALSFVIVERLNWLTILVALAVLLRHRDRAVGQLRHAWAGLLAVLLAIASLSWTASPSLTGTRVVGLVAATAVGLALAAARPPRSQLACIGLVFVGLLIVSVAVAWLTPQVGLMSGPQAGALRGWYSNRNHLGRAIAWAIPVFWILGRERLWPWRLVIVMLALAGLVLVASGSRGSMVVAVALSAATVALASWRDRSACFRRAVTVTVLGAAAAAVVLLLGPWGDAALRLIGRDATLSARTHIWETLAPFAQAHPWTGYGYGAFWQGAGAGPSAGVAMTLGWYPWHAHNGLYDLVLELGLLGVAVFVVPYVWITARLLHQAKRYGGAAVWPALYCLHFALSNVVESELLYRSSWYWAMYIAAACSMSPRGTDAETGDAPP